MDAAYDPQYGARPLRRYVQHTVETMLSKRLLRGDVTPEIIRPLWLNQAFFTEDVDGLHYHELCLYFLMDISHTDLLSKGEKFTLLERHHTHKFEWLPFERLEREYFYPLFLKKEIFHLPEALTLRTELE